MAILSPSRCSIIVLTLLTLTEVASFSVSSQHCLTRGKLAAVNQGASDYERSPPWKRISTIMSRFSGVKTGSLQKGSEEKAPSLFGKIRRLYGPIFFFFATISVALRHNKLFGNPGYLCWLLFTVKWYRARYVFKIPVWDRHPSWNNIITSREQEQDLKALTCRTCGSTLFIAKSREFYFEGNLGIKALGCFTCGAIGKDNFYQDRERIVEHVGDMDDFFEYERPLDFVSRAERRSLLKETEGDEEKANQLIMERSEKPVSGKEKAARAEFQMTEDIAKEDANVTQVPDAEEDATVEETTPSSLRSDSDEAPSGPDPQSGDGLDILDMDSL